MTFHTRPRAMVNSLPCPHECADFQGTSKSNLTIHCATELKWDFTRPNNLVDKPCILYHIPLKLVTKLHVLIRIIFIHGMLQPSNARFPPISFQNTVYTCPANSCFLRTSSYGYSGDREKCCNTTPKEAGLVSLCGFQIISCAHLVSYLRTQNCHKCVQLLLVLRVSVANSRRRSVWISHTFSNFQYHFKSILRCSNVKRSDVGLFYWLNPVRRCWCSCH